MSQASAPVDDAGHSPSRYTESEAATLIQDTFREHRARKRAGSEAVGSIGGSHALDDSQRTFHANDAPTKTQQFDKMLEEEKEEEEARQRGRSSSTAAGGPARLGARQSPAPGAKSPASGANGTGTTNPSGDNSGTPTPVVTGSNRAEAHPSGARHSGHQGDHDSSHNIPPPPLPRDTTTSDEMEGLVLWKIPKLASNPAAPELFALDPKEPHVRFDTTPKQKRHKGKQSSTSTSSSRPTSARTRTSDTSAKHKGSASSGTGKTNGSGETPSRRRNDAQTTKDRLGTPSQRSAARQQPQAATMGKGNGAAGKGRNGGSSGPRISPRAGTAEGDDSVYRPWNYKTKEEEVEDQ